MLQIVGTCDQRLFGITPAERLQRQRRDTDELTLVASASVVLGASALAWLLENPGNLLLTPGGRPAAIAAEPSQVDSAVRLFGAPASAGVDPAAIGDVFIRKLRRRDMLFVRSLDEQPVREVEKQLFDSVYKGITDLVTKYAWPLPAYWVTTLCSRLHIHPNVVTVTGMAAMVLATLLWASAELVAGMLFAWLMTFLDTVDGKLARVTVKSSRLGNLLDHVTDVIHPPFWWLALAYGLTRSAGAARSELIWLACLVILGGYVIGRFMEGMFKSRFGYNCYLWRPFDSAFRLVTSRRNIILLIMSVGFVFGVPVEAFVAAAAWTFVSAAIQVVRLAQALYAGRGGSLPSWLM